MVHDTRARSPASQPYFSVFLRAREKYGWLARLACTVVQSTMCELQMASRLIIV